MTAASVTAVRVVAGSARAVKGAAELAHCDSLSDDDGAFDSPRSDSFLSLCSDNDWGTPGSAFATPMLAASTPLFTAGSTPVIAGSTPTYRGRPPTVAAIAARLARLSSSPHADATAGAADVTTVAEGSAVVTVAAATAAIAVGTDGRRMPAAAGGSEDTGATCSGSSGVRSDGCSSYRNDACQEEHVMLPAPEDWGCLVGDLARQLWMVGRLWEMRGK
ncbi:unnamed protein product [Closterium sp. NIES-65]|nr:unnamed protein product [Closterium sp. NIES-65]